jgi:hypothetical protein
MIQELSAEHRLLLRDKALTPEQLIALQRDKSFTFGRLRGEPKMRCRCRIKL